MVRVVPRSHLLPGGPCGTKAIWPWLRFRDELRARSVAVPLKAGEAAIWDNRLIHMSFDNNSATPRLAVGMWCHRSGGSLVHFARTESGYLQFDVDEQFFLEETPALLYSRNPSRPVTRNFECQLDGIEEEALRGLLDGTTQTPPVEMLHDLVDEIETATDE